MLEGIDKIEWSNLTHAYGAASDVPNLLRQLASSSGDDREHAMHELYGNIWHQGTIYEASVQAVPFLIQLLGSAVVEGKVEIFILLAHLARGTSYHDVHQHLAMFKSKAQTPEWQADIQKELAWVRGVKAAVLAGEDTYLTFLADGEMDLRDASAYLLASLGRPVPGLAAKVWSRFEQEPKESVRASLLLAFGNLADSVEKNINLLAAYLVAERSKSVRLAAAMALVRLAPEQLTREALSVLLEAALSPNDYDALAESVWGRVDDVELMIVSHLACLNANSLTAALEMLEKILPTCDHQQALRIAEVSLNMVFGKTIARGTAFAALNENQQHVLKVVAQHRNVWIEKIGNAETYSVKTSMLLRSCGLPDEMAKLISYVANEEHQTPTDPSISNKPGFVGIVRKLLKPRSRS